MRRQGGSRRPSSQPFRRLRRNRTKESGSRRKWKGKGTERNRKCGSSGNRRKGTGRSRPPRRRRQGWRLPGSSRRRWTEFGEHRRKPPGKMKRKDFGVNWRSSSLEKHRNSRN